MIDFIRLLKDNKIPYRIDTDNYVNINCPYHDNGDRGFKGGINLLGGFYHCWTCEGSSIEKVLSELLHLSFYETKKLLEEYSTETIVRQKLNRKKSKGKKIILPGVKIEGKAFNYIVNRRFDPDTIIRDYGITWGGITGKWSFRIIIPIVYHNQLVSFQARSIYSKEKCDELGILRYKNYPIELGLVNIKHIFFNLDNCLEDWLLIVEGVFDCWRLGTKNVASCMGTSMSEEQIVLLANRFKKVIFLFDNEKMAQDRAKKYGQRLAGLGIEVEIFNPEFEHDPGDYNASEEAEVRRELCLNI